MLTAPLTNNNFSPKDMLQLLSLKKKNETDCSCCLYYLHFTEEDKVSCSRSHTMVCHRDGFHIRGLSTQGSIPENLYLWDEIFTGVLWPNIIGRSFIHMELTSNSVAYLKGAGSKLGLGQKIRPCKPRIKTIPSTEELNFLCFIKHVGMITVLPQWIR